MLSDAGGENDGSSAISERSLFSRYSYIGVISLELIRKYVLSTTFAMHAINATGPGQQDGILPWYIRKPLVSSLWQARTGCEKDDLTIA